MTSLYIHIPFCKKKCNYCDFVSYAGKEDLIDGYVEALCDEINSPPCQHGSNPPPSLVKRGGKEGGEFSTVYFGGGTPTLFSPKHFEKIISTIICHLTFDIGHSEISVEANPGTADKAKLKSLRSLGINRLSIGVQSFNDKHLKTLGRIHSAQEAVQFYKDARSAGFDNINLDLIFALPGQTLEEWKIDLQTALNLTTARLSSPKSKPRSPEPVEGPNHLSTYNLQIEEGTPFSLSSRAKSRDWEKGASLAPADEGFRLPSEDEELAMYEYTIETLTVAGYKHYEISNFAKPGFECLHNINYWKNGNYVGIGAGAHSHVNGQRWANPNCLETYLRSWKPETERLGFQQHEETAPMLHRGRFPSAPDQRETLFLGLRLLEGLPIEKFAGFEKEVAELTNDGLLEQKNGHYRLTRHGLYLGNLVFEKFI